MQNRKLEYEQQRLEKEVADMQEAFDAALALLSREKLSLEADVKAADIKRLTYQQEMQLLKVICIHDLHQANHFAADVVASCPESVQSVCFHTCPLVFAGPPQQQQGCLHTRLQYLLVALHRSP